MGQRRLLPLSGLAFVALVCSAVLGLGAVNAPVSGSSGEEVASFYDAHSWQQFAAAFVVSASVPFLVLFAVGLATALPEADPARRPVWERVLVGGSVLAGTALLLTAVLAFALADGADQGVSPTALQALNLVGGNLWIALNSGLGVLMLGAAGTLFPRARPARALGWAALVLGIALFIPFADFFALLLTGVWIVVVSVIQFRERREPRYAVTPRTA